MTYRMITAGLFATLAAGCAAPGAPVPVQGETAKLEGQWLGEYSSAESGRSGSIVFTLQPGRDTAQGDVLMTPSTWVSRPSAPEPPYPSELLEIRFVQVSGKQVTGQLAPYRDPECGCIVTTIFTGRLKGDVLSGTYRTYHQYGERTVEGRWRVVREKARE